MSKIRKSILIIGILVIVVAASLATALALFATGSIKTDPVELVFAVKDEEKVYDGTPLKATEYKLVSGSLLSGHTARIEILGEQTSVGVSESDLSVKIYDKEGYNVTSGYTVKVECGELKVDKKSISVDLPSQQVVYNGSKVLFTDYKIAEGGLVNGHKIYGSTEAGLLNVGDTLPEELTPLIFDVAGNDVTENYEIEFNPGEIEVIPRYVSVRPVTSEKVYDGTALAVEGVEYVEGTLVEGQYARYEINHGYDNRLINADEIVTQVTEFKIYEFINGEEVDVTSNYEIDTYETGKLTVTPRPLHITGKSATFVYDGNEHSLSDDTKPESVDGLVPDEEIISVTYGGAITDVGTKTNVLREVVLSSRSSNYTITFTFGTLEVTPYELDITTGSAEKYYDGAIMTEQSLNVTLANADHRINLAAGQKYPFIIDAGSVVNEYVCAITDKNGRDVTQNYSINYNYGTLTVNKTPVVAHLNGLEEIEYNAEARLPDLSNPDYFSLTAVDEEHTNKLKLTHENFEIESNVRFMRNVAEYSYKVKFNDKELYNNYTLEVPESGYLTIYPKAVTVDTGSKREAYSGNPVFDKTPVITEGALAAGHSFGELKVYPYLINVGKLENDYKLTVADSVGAEVTRNYDIKYNYGTLEVTKCEAIVTLDNFVGQKAFVYSNKHVNISAEDAVLTVVPDIIARSEFAIDYAAETIDVGADYTYTVHIADKTLADNFNLKIAGRGSGRIEVKPLDIAVTIRDVMQTYNGEAYILDSYSAIQNISNTSTGLSRDDFEVSFNDAKSGHTDAAGYEYTVAIRIEKRKNYNLTVINSADDKGTATLFIKKFPIAITTDSASFVYNGEDRKLKKYSYSALANSMHTISVITVDDDLPFVNRVNTVENEFYFDVRDGAGKSVINNYEIIYKWGTLTVTPRPVTVTTGTVSRVYDGQPLSYAEASSGNLCNGHSLVPVSDELGETEFPEITDIGSVKNEFKCKIVDNMNGDFTDNYLVTYVYGTITRTKRPVTIFTPSVTEKYGLNEISDINVVKYNNLVDGHTVIADVEEGNEPRRREVGTTKNEFACKIYCDADDVTDNYTITYEYGTLTVTPLTVTVTLNDFDTFVYDGSAKILEPELAIASITNEFGNFYTEDGIVIADDGDGSILIGRAFFEIVCSGVMLDAGEYTYSVKFVDATYANNFILNQNTGRVSVKKFEANVTLRSFTGADALTFDNRVQSVAPEIAVIAIEDNAGDLVSTALLDAGDFEIVYSGSLLNAGDYTYKVRLSDVVKAKNFIINCFEETITVEKLAVDLSLKNYTFEYNGRAAVISAGDAVRVDTALIKGSDFTLTVNGDAVNAGDYTYTATLTDAKYAQNFTFGTAMGNISITPLEITVALKDYAFTYSGNAYALSVADAVTISNPLVKPEDITLTYPELKNAGDYTYEATVTDAHGNFTISKNAGNVKINKLAVNVTLNNLSKVYDGADYRITETAAIHSISSALLTAADFNLTFTDGRTEHTDVGTYSFRLVLKAAVAGNFQVTFTGGSAAITPRAVTITTQTAEITYTGVKLEGGGVERAAGLATGHKAAIANGAVKPSVTEAGSVVNRFVCTITDGNNRDVTANYEVKYDYGTLTVKKRAVTVTRASETRVYNGTTLTNGDIINTPFALGQWVDADGDLPEITNVGTVENRYLIKITDGTADFTHNYEITYKYGTLEVTLAAVQVTLNPVTVTYNGNVIRIAATDAIATVSNGLIGKDDFEVVYNRAVKNVDVYNYTVKISSEETARNFILTAGTGVITVEKSELQITLGNLTQKYSGTAKTADTQGMTILGDNPDGLTAADFKVVCNAEMKNAGTYSFGAEIADKELAKNYALTVTEGTLTIEKLGVEVTLKDYTKVYKGSAYTVDVADAITDISCEGGAALLNRSDFAAVYNNELIKAGNFTYGVEISNRERANNFDLTIANAGGSGSFEIAKRKIVLKLDEVRVSQDEYDNKGSTGDYDVSKFISVSTDTPLAEGDTFIVTEAWATGDGFGKVELYLMDVYVLDNADCYEFVNYNGSNMAITAALVVIG